MAELIDRKELRKFPIRIDHYDKENGSLDFVLGIETVFEYIEYLPTIEAKPVVHAHWETDFDFDPEEEQERYFYFCSKCKNELFGNKEDFKYCPYCGAQMDEVVSDNNVGSKTEGEKIPVISMEDVPKLAKEMKKSDG